VNQVYLKSLGRLPRQEEMNPAIKLFNQSSRKEAVEDVLWAVMLLPEFQLIY
jgi:hypothetical protein